jgi:uncharacterized integral membrane protein
MKRALALLIAFPTAVVLVSLAVANRHSVRMALNPFRPEDDVLSISLPLFIYLLGALIVGVAIGGFATWMSQRRWRTMARMRLVECRRWQAEAERLGRERDDVMTAAARAATAPADVVTARPRAIAGR